MLNAQFWDPKTCFGAFGGAFWLVFVGDQWSGNGGQKGSRGSWFIPGSPSARDPGHPLFNGLETGSERLEGELVHSRVTKREGPGAPALQWSGNGGQKGSRGSWFIPGSPSARDPGHPHFRWERMNKSSTRSSPRSQARSAAADKTRGTRPGPGGMTRSPLRGWVI